MRPTLLVLVVSLVATTYAATKLNCSTLSYCTDCMQYSQCAWCQEPPANKHENPFCLYNGEDAYKKCDYLADMCPTEAPTATSTGSSSGDSSSGVSSSGDSSSGSESSEWTEPPDGKVFWQVVPINLFLIALIVVANFKNRGKNKKIAAEHMSKSDPNDFSAFPDPEEINEKIHDLVTQRPGEEFVWADVALQGGDSLRSSIGLVISVIFLVVGIITVITFSQAFAWHWYMFLGIDLLFNVYSFVEIFRQVRNMRGSARGYTTLYVLTTGGAITHINTPLGWMTKFLAYSDMEPVSVGPTIFNKTLDSVAFITVVTSNPKGGTTRSRQGFSSIRRGQEVAELIRSRRTENVVGSLQPFLQASIQAALLQKQQYQSTLPQAALLQAALLQQRYQGGGYPPNPPPAPPAPSAPSAPGPPSAPSMDDPNQPLLSQQNQQGYYQQQEYDAYQRPSQQWGANSQGYPSGYPSGQSNIQ